MVQLTEERLDAILAEIQGKTIAVIGDLMLDRYIWGSVTRISPEAPVPVIDVETEQERLGGAANVARNIKALGGNPLLVGVAGADTGGEALRRLIGECGFSTQGVIVDPSRPTTIKTRIIAHDQHVARVDSESRADISVEIRNRIMDSLREQIEKIDGIIIEDYNKGVVNPDIIQSVIAMAREHGKIITVDPKFSNFFAYTDVSLFKPNRKEVEGALGVSLRTDTEVMLAGKELLKRLRAGGVLLTRGEKGMTLFSADGTIAHTDTRARTVADVSGAGDTVIATLTLALTAGGSMAEASTLANYAGGVVCGQVGIVPILPEELRAAVLGDARRERKETSA